MAQLPPKIPNIPQNWPPFPHHKMSAMANFNPTNTTQQQQYHHSHHQQEQQQNSSPPLSQQLPSWVDEFLDFSSARCGAHRRSASDSVTFLEEYRSSSTVAGAQGFDRLDEEQLVSMFSDDIASGGFPSALSNPSTPSDQNSNNDEKPMVLDEVVPAVIENQQQPPPKNSEQGEVDSSCKNETASPPSSVAPSSVETIADPKRVKRILANRQSAQRSRVRKLQYISDLEKSVTTLQTEVSALSPRVAFLDHQRLVLNIDNSALKQRIAALAQDKIFKDAHQEALKKEIERLRQVYEQQKLQKRGNSVNNNNNIINGNSLPFAAIEKEQLLS
ncbi:hypothetical protein QN277_002528 [Acacia crassicarpa]|uniref:BZIP domain-containing protein n=1 Tax=Acacia crassicarpa TaxID=499986 RepID=A0AAE1NAN7_9FABA|nr:hypothetical protein QN277_002528 [Acacia crassicarpa]